MREWRVPDEILRLFDHEETKPEGRKQAIGWLRSHIGEIREGDTVEMPNAATGEIERLTKAKAGIQ